MRSYVDKSYNWVETIRIGAYFYVGILFASPLKGAL